jgi:homoserine dehydrogenase
MRIVLIGCGSVGKALVQMLDARRAELYQRLGWSPKLVAVADSGGFAADPAGLDADALLLAKTRDGSVGAHARGTRFDGRTMPVDLIRRTSADVVVEAAPSVLARAEPGIDNLMAALSSGKHVVSVNKAPLAVAMPALLDLARYNKRQLRFSGTVGAGTPVLATARTLAAGDQILSIRGILNGTTNFILWRMLEHNDTYPAALAQAIRLGYAETDPSADVDGHDTASKVVILANAVLNLGVSVRDVQIQGVRDMPKDAVDDAARQGMSLKLIGAIDARSRRVSVSPEPVPRKGPMDVPANTNAVQFTMASAGEVTLVGRGAGGPETATAIVRDLIDIWHEAGEPT